MKQIQKNWILLQKIPRHLRLKKTKDHSKKWNQQVLFLSCNAGPYNIIYLILLYLPCYPFSKLEFQTYPKDPRTLLKTQTCYNLKEFIGGGLFYYFGIKENVTETLERNYTHASEQNEIKMQINIDGLPLFKSSNWQFWPILGLILNIPYQNPFIIGLFYGEHKPKNVDEYLEDFITECNELSENGLRIENKHYHFKLSSVICDTPARSYVKQVKGHTGYSGCDKCIQSGEWNNKMTFPETNASPRTNTQFRERSDEDHHTGMSPFIRTDLDMIKDFPLDYMHLVCLGIVKRLIHIWMRGPLKTRQRARTIESISQDLVSLRHNIPSEFARKPRPLKDVTHWKATEFRQFLLYTGPIVLLKNIDHELYGNFMLLFVAIFILVSPDHCQTHNAYAHELLITFVQHFSRLYGESMLVYNVHGLCHFSDDVRRFGNLDAFSAFPYENFLQKLKRSVRKPSTALQQIIRRISEEKCFISQALQNTRPVLSKEHERGPIPLNTHTDRQFEKVSIGKCVLSVSEHDRCIMVNDSVGLIQNIVSSKNEILVVYSIFGDKQPAFDYPLRSDLLGIYSVAQIQEQLHTATLSELKKLVLLPQKDRFTVIPMAGIW